MDNLSLIYCYLIINLAELFNYYINYKFGRVIQLLYK